MASADVIHGFRDGDRVCHPDWTVPGTVQVHHEPDPIADAEVVWDGGYVISELTEALAANLTRI